MDIYPVRKDSTMPEPGPAGRESPSLKDRMKGLSFRSSKEEREKQSQSGPLSDSTDSAQRNATDPSETASHISTQVEASKPEEDSHEEQGEGHNQDSSPAFPFSTTPAAGDTMRLEVQEIPGNNGAPQDFITGLTTASSPETSLGGDEETGSAQELQPTDMQSRTVESGGSEEKVPGYVWRIYGHELSPENAPQLGDPEWQLFQTVVAGQQGMYRLEGDSNSNARGSYADVSKREAWFEGKVHMHVAVKRLHLLNVVDPSRPKTSDVAERCRKRLNKETKIWMTLSHPNIVPLLGFHDNNAFCMISPWFENGNIHEYLHKTGPTARERLLLIQQVASGVAYLHELTPPIVHGDLKPDNVVVDNFGVSRIIDFGLSRVVQDAAEAGFQSSSSRTGGNTRWLAPELLMKDGKARESSSDVYSFACTALYIMSGVLPFIQGYVTEPAVCWARFQGAQPMIPGVNYPTIDSIPGLHLLLQRCWVQAPVERPDMQQVVTDLARL